MSNMERNKQILEFVSAGHKRQFLLCKCLDIPQGTLSKILQMKLKVSDELFNLFLLAQDFVEAKEDVLLSQSAVNFYVKNLSSPSKIISETAYRKLVAFSEEQRILQILH